VGFVKSRLIVSCCLAVSVWILPAAGQTESAIAPPGTNHQTGFPGQEFHCHTGYSLAQCQTDILQLKKVLARYPIERLGHWTWVLVRSQDWKPISRMLRLNPESPAFTALEPRETFLEEALFVHDPQRTAELMQEWRSSIPELLELAVTHELGHAFCASGNEVVAQRFSEDLRNGREPRCQLLKNAGHRSVLAKEPQGLKQDISRGP
jgi:hypothetical protein